MTAYFVNVYRDDGSNMDLNIEVRADYIFTAQVRAIHAIADHFGVDAGDVEGMFDWEIVRKFPLMPWETQDAYLPKYGDQYIRRWD